MEEKKCPVDRGRLLIALECCRRNKCTECPYCEKNGCPLAAEDALAYIGFLEEQLGVTGV